MKSESNNSNPPQNQKQTASRNVMVEYISDSEYIINTDVLLHKWKYSPVSSATTADPREIIDQYYILEGKHCPTKSTTRLNFKHFDTALPRHYAFIAASRQPRQFSSLTHFQTSRLQSSATQNKIQSKSCARTHTVGDITPFTNLTIRQKNFVIAHAGLAHLVVKKLAGVFCAKPHTRRAALERADIIASFISSALACEYLVGNRYYRNLPTILASVSSVVGHPEDPRHYNDSLTTADTTRLKIQETEEILQVLCDANIDRLESCMDQYERGFVSLETLRTDPEFVKMFANFWKLNFQTMKWRSISEARLTSAAHIAANQSKDKDSAERIIVCRQIFSSQCRFARLFQYRIAHIFDNSNFGFAGLVRSAKSSHLRLCNDGMSAALLTFAAIEPRMVSTEMAPKLGLLRLTCNTCNVSSAANHIQSRDPVFGDLLATHRDYIPKTNALYNTNGNRNRNYQIWRDPVSVSASAKTYIPVQNMLESIRTGQTCWPEKNDRRNDRRGKKVLHHVARHHVAR